MRIAIPFILMVLGGCAAVHVKRDIVDEKGNHVGTVEVAHGSTTAQGAIEILDGTRRYEESARGGDIAQQALARGMPVDFSTGMARVSAGDRYNGYGGGYGVYGGPYAPLVMAEQLTFAASPYGQQRFQLPQLRQYGPAPPQVYLQPQQQLPVLVGGGREACPNDRDPMTEGERLTCLEVGQKFLTKEVVR